ncbi:MAG: ABC transporter permease [Acidimicrobiales bacterium]
MPSTDLSTNESASRSIDEELAGLDALDLPVGARAGRLARSWSAVWPKVMAIVITIALWQLVYLSGWKPPWVFPPPGAVFGELWERLVAGQVGPAALITLERAVTGFAVAMVIGMAVGAVVSQVRFLRVAFGSLITGLQTMPSIVWFPFAILLFGLNESAIFFVVVLGAAPAIANGLITGADQVPPILVRAGRVLGAGRVGLYRHVILPASLPSFVGGLKQGWAFAWRSLMAGELLVIIPARQSLGTQLQFARDFNDMDALMATMLVILAIGVIVDAVFFGTVDRAIRRRWGLLDASV